ncbi:MAG: ergothioneine biosynthesis protein EgtB [Acidobacteria bacterium]|nr:ergothioneine biosynthesis protein EgtB [Acidobacteriota bacterium]
MPLTSTTARSVDSASSPAAALRAEALDWYRRNRLRTAALFSVLTPDTLYAQPIAQRHPNVFYQGHLPGFSLNTLVKRALGQPGIDERLERLFARGIDPDEQGHDAAAFIWPGPDDVRAFADAADAKVLDALAHAELDQPGHPLLDRADAVFAILEHEAMHQETLLYMWHRLPHQAKRAPADYAVQTGSTTITQGNVLVPSGRAALGARRGEIRFGWDNEFPGPEVEVEAFRIDRLDVTNGDMLAFIDAGGYRTPEFWSDADWAWVQAEQRRHPTFWERHGNTWMWRGMFEWLPLPMAWPAYVSHAEASAYASWRGRRLPTDAEFQRAAYGSPDERSRRYPWGEAAPTTAHGVFDFSSWEPAPVGTHPDGQSAWGVHDLVGNGWEWTSTVFRPFDGFTPGASYPEYSADFFDDSHFVLKGGSQATACELIRPSFRNWFRPRYPYVYATFRTVEGPA